MFLKTHVLPTFSLKIQLFLATILVSFANIMNIDCEIKVSETLFASKLEITASSANTTY